MHMPQHLPTVLHAVGEPGQLDKSDQTRWWLDIKLQHLRNRVAMNAKPLCRLPAAQPVHHHSASYPGIEFHYEYPPSHHATQWHRDGLTGLVHFCAAVYMFINQIVGDGLLGLKNDSVISRIRYCLLCSSVITALYSISGISVPTPTTCN